MLVAFKMFWTRNHCSSSWMRPITTTLHCCFMVSNAFNQSSLETKTASYWVLLMNHEYMWGKNWNSSYSTPKLGEIQPMCIIWMIYNSMNHLKYSIWMPITSNWINLQFVYILFISLDHINKITKKTSQAQTNFEKGCMCFNYWEVNICFVRFQES
jgi:hypothetical protein